MSEGNLDDFFQKRDRKKKPKSAVATGSSGGVGDADSATGKKKKSRSKPKNSTSQNSGEEKREDASNDPLTALRASVPQDEEWNDYVEEKEPDLSGLRIQNVPLAGKREEDDGKEDQEDEGEEGDDASKADQREATSGPWNKISMSGTASGVQQVAPEPMPEPVVEETRTSGGKYVPPNLRGLGSGTATKSASSKRTKKSAPDMASTEDFPTLGKGPMAQARPAGNQYYQDNDGTSHVYQRKGPELTLENKFSALQE